MARSKGLCRFCLKTITGAGMSRHLKSCPLKKEKEAAEAGAYKGKGQIYHLKMSLQPFWLHLEMNDSATLSDLDKFLRYIWLECCGHLSRFEIGGAEYESHPDPAWSAAASMDIPLKKVLHPGREFIYDYDFGSTTRLYGDVINVRPGKLRGEKVRILARNNPPEWTCESCGKKAAVLCLECGEFFCNKCRANSRKHTCDADMYETISNSPRMGACAYEEEPAADPFMQKHFGN